MNDIFHIDVIIIKVILLESILNYIIQVIFWFLKFVFKKKL